MRLVQAWTKDSVEYQPWHAIPERMAALGLTAEDGMTQVWFVEANGALTGGAAAANEVLRYVWWAKPFTVLYKLPGLKQLEDKLYRWVADHRHQMPGGTAVCGIEKRPKQGFE